MSPGLTEAVKLHAARWLYRLQLSQSIVGAVFSALTFSGVFTLLLGPLLATLGIGYSGTLAILLAAVVVVLLVFGLFMDQVVKFWEAQAKIGTVRNPFLLGRLYQKDFMNMKYGFLVQLEALLAVLDTSITEESRERILRDLRASVERMQETLAAKEWRIDPDDYVYGDSH